MGKNKYWKHIYLSMYFTQESLRFVHARKIDWARTRERKFSKDLLLLFYVLSYVLSYSIHVDPASLGIYLVHGQLQSFQLLPFPTFLIVSHCSMSILQN